MLKNVFFEKTTKLAYLEKFDRFKCIVIWGRNEMEKGGSWD